jgi:hypothetical protein
MARETQTHPDRLFSPEELSKRLSDGTSRGTSRGTPRRKSKGTSRGTSAGPSPRTLERWRKDGAGPAYIKVGHLVRYRESDVERWLDEQTRTHTRQEPTTNF